MRTYVSPIGYNSTSVTRPVLSRGLDTDDEVILVRPAEETTDSRAQEAINDVNRMLTEIEPDVALTVEQIPHDDLPAAVLQCSDVIRDGAGDRIVTLGGGARDILLPLTFAALTHVPLIETVLFFSDIDGTVREWELPRLTAPISEAVGPTLTAIAHADDYISIPELTTVTEQSKSTVTRHVNQLDSHDIVETWKDGRTKYTQLSFTGHLLMRGRSDG